MKSFFARLFGKSTHQVADNAGQSAEGKLLLEPVQVADDLILPRVLADRIDEMKKFARRTVSIKALPSQELSLTQSKFGHYSCLPSSFEYPRDSAGNYLYPLAQINFSEVPHLENFPTSGFLQFYIAADDVFGLSFEKDVPSEFKVFFFEESELQDPMKDMSFLDELLSEASSPVHQPHALKFTLKTEYVGMGDVHGGSKAGLSLDEIVAAYPNLRRKIEDVVFENFSATGHKLGGFAYFTQWDPREDNDTEDYVLLFQMDSDEHILWGDVGVGNFFIDPSDLKNKDFSKVMYNWDCH